VEPSIIARIDVTNVDRVIRHLRPLSVVLCERGTAGYFDLVEGGAAIIGNAREDTGLREELHRRLDDLPFPHAARFVQVLRDAIPPQLFFGLNASLTCLLIDL
jgi:hypothetical protein